MTTAERMPTASASNVLYTRLAKRFCPDGNTTLGARMLEASTRVKATSADIYADGETIDTAYRSADTDKISARNAFFRNLIAVFLTTAIVLSLAYSFVLMTNKNSGSRGDHIAFPIATAERSTVEAGSLAASEYATAYADFFSE